MIESTNLQTPASQAVPRLGARLDARKMPAHWLMARLGKRVLRPGGLGLTRWLLDHGRIGPADDVIELAPGLGRTAALILARTPHGYAGVERDEDAARLAERAIAHAGFADTRIVRGHAESVPLDGSVASVVIGEAMLSMQPAATRQAIMAEACRLLRPGGRYLIHELAVVPDAIDPEQAAEIQRDLSAVIHVGVRIGTVRAWTEWLEEAGFVVEETETAPMQLLERRRMISDEGIGGVARFVWNALRTPGAIARLRAVRGVFRTHGQHLCAVGVVAVKRPRTSVL